MAGRPTRANFRTGTLTVCTMVPMRSVPHRVVCLIGLDDGVFPRLDRVDGDDVLARRPMTGERDIRSEDRQLLLDAVCAATETLVITYTGNDEHTGHPHPPAVPLAELIDALDQTTETPVHEHIVTKHPLQPFDVKNVQPGRLVPGTAFTFDPTALTAAEAAAGKRCAPPPFIAGPLPAPPAEDVALADLIDFYKDPVKGFFRALDCALPWDVDEVEDAMPIEIDPLEEWTVGDRMLRDMLRGMHPDTAAHAEWRRGTLPPGRLGVRKAKEIRDRARDLALAALQHMGTDGDAHDVDVDLGGGRRLTGTITPVFGDRTVSVTYSKLAPKHVLASWIGLVALAAQNPGHNWTALCIGRGKSRNRIATRVFAPPPDPVSVSRDLVALYDAGRREPLPLPLKTSCAWAEARRDGADPQEAAQAKWQTTRFHTGEDADRAHARAWGENPAFEQSARSTAPGRTAARGRHPAGCARRPALAAGAGRRGEPLMDRFDLLGPLPKEGSTTVLEASAGTGKTFALAGLVTRYLAETDMTLGEMLLITFNRAASRELRERVRAQIAEAVSALDGRAAGWQRARRAPGDVAATTNAQPGERGYATRWRTSTQPPLPPRTSFADRC